MSQTPTIIQLRAVLAVATSPLQYVVDAPSRLYGFLDSSLSDYRSLLAENAELRKQNLLLKVEMQKLMALQRENTNLRSLLQASTQLHDKILIAQLLSVATDSHSHEIVLNKGSLEGVYVGQPLVDADGVMGQIVEVNPLTSRAMLLVDARSQLPVENNRNGIRAVAVGQGAQNTLLLKHVPQTADILEGDLFVTSGLGERYPAGYPVGVVTHIEHVPGEPFTTVIIQPHAHIDRSRQVLLIWPTSPVMLLDLEEAQGEIDE